MSATGRRPVVAVVGAVAWNHLVSVPRMPSDLRTLHASDHRWGIGGTGAGKALHLARLGLDTRLHALLGADAEGDAVRAVLAEAGVELTWWPDPRGTERHLNLMDPRGERLSIILDHGTEDPAVSAGDLLAHTEGADVVMVSLAAYTRRLLPHLSTRGVPVWVDLHDWDGEESFHADFVEHGTHVFVSDVRLEDPLELATRLVGLPGKELVVVTHGSRGATAFFPDREPLFLPPVRVGAVVDTNGAGDAFAAGVAYGLVHGWDRGRALQAGAVVAAGCVASAELADPWLSPDWLREQLATPQGR